MSASLSDQDDPDAFKIESLDDYATAAGEPVPKTLPPNGFAQWNWRVTPFKSGTQTLIVRAYITVPLSGLALPPVNVYQKSQVITVPVVPLYRRGWSYTKKLVQGHLGDLLKWSWTALLVPLFAWLWKRTKKRRFPTKPEPDKNRAQPNKVTGKKKGKRDNIVA